MRSTRTGSGWNGRASALWLVGITAGSSLTMTNAQAQPAAPAQAQPAAPAQAQPAAPTQTQAPVGSPAPAAAAPDDDIPAPEEMMASKPGGITAAQVGARAAATSYHAKAAEENLRGAGQRSEQAWTNYLPRIGTTARYTRLSKFTPPSLSDTSSSTQANIVGTQAPAGAINPAPTFSFPFPNFAFPLVLDQYVLQATIAVPLSDYFLRISQGYTAATHAEDAARWDVVAARAKSHAEGKIAYYTWLRARGAYAVTEQSLAVARAHLKDAENQFAVGNASKADVLRAQTGVAAAELAVERAKNGVALTARQVRIAIHATDAERLEPGEGLDGPVPPAPTNVRAIIDEAHRSRPEIKSIDKNAAAARKLASVANAGKYPQLSAFGDLTYANPNQRRFPQRSEWFPTWAVGAQVTWSPNDLVAAGPAAGDADARAAALEAQRGAVRDGIELEATQAYQAIREADAAIASTLRQLESATEGYRVARELFNAGRGTATTLTDAETILAQTRFEHLNAKVDARIARIRLEHALGRDAQVAGQP